MRQQLFTIHSSLFTGEAPFFFLNSSFIIRGFPSFTSSLCFNINSYLSPLSVSLCLSVSVFSLSASLLLCLDPQVLRLYSSCTHLVLCLDFIRDDYLHSSYRFCVLNRGSPSTNQPIPRNSVSPHPTGDRSVFCTLSDVPVDESDLMCVTRIFFLPSVREIFKLHLREN